jgi:hypothetical protein
MGDFLIPYNFPKNDPKIEEDTDVLKTMEVVVDGYSAVLHYNKADYSDHYLITFQVFGKHCPFLPFIVVAKLARKFLGEKNLSLVELLRNNRKVYCWTLYADLEGNPIKSKIEERGEFCTFEGFKYTYMSPTEINFY